MPNNSRIEKRAVEVTNARRARQSTDQVLREIGLEEFVRRLRADTADIRSEKRFALFLGAGCSVTSGIPSAGGLVRDRWLPRLRSYQAPARSDLEVWAKEVIPDYDPLNPALSYGILIDRLFLTPEDRQREIEDLCDARTPSFGYAVLAQLVAQPAGRFNVVLTTNFDDLVSDALYLYTEARPLVIYHESLAAFIRPTRTRPLVVKLHGDHRLSPRNTALETETLEQEIQRHAAMVLHDRGVIFIGYGGADVGILKLLNQLPPEALPFGAYWVHPHEPLGEVRDWLLSRQGVWVRSGWFDEVMLLIRNEFGLPHPSGDRFTRIFQDYQQKFQELSNSIQDRPADEAGVQALQKALSDTEALFPDFWKAISQARRLARHDPIRADEAYRQGVDQFPNDAPLLGSYAVFLSDIRKDYEAAEAMFKRALEAEPKNAITLGNYALFLKKERKDYDAAEAMYKLAREADPKDANNLSRYANFLSDIRKDYDAAEAMHERALEADPKNANNNANLARLLLATGKPDGLVVLDRTLQFLQETALPKVELECSFYMFAHGPIPNRTAALRNMRTLLEQDVRSLNWDLSLNIQHALQERHPEGTWLTKLAAVVNDKAQPDVLSDWPTWQTVAAQRTRIDRAKPRSYPVVGLAPYCY